MKILIYGNRKQDPDVYDISTPEKELAGYLMLFNILDQDWNVYDEIKSEKSMYKKSSLGLLEEARKGNAESARLLLNRRKVNEYEDFQIIEPIDPLEDQ